MIRIICRAALENLKNQVKVWSERALSACRAESRDCATLLSLEDLKQLVKEGEHLPFADEASINLLAQLKQEAKSARQWIQKLSKAGIGAGVTETSSSEGAVVATQVFDASTVSARSELVTSLLSEAQTISVDLTQYTDQLTQMCTTYCLCRHLVILLCSCRVFASRIINSKFYACTIVSWPNDRLRYL